VILPVMFCISLLIWLVSDGPILFRQPRVGFKGSRFLCYKFRTMHADTEVASHQGHLQDLIGSKKPMTKLDHVDPRIIPFGRPLRSSGLDELPQLFNVLRGEMSLVGPRPCIVYEYEKYEPWQKERFNSLPGLTGLWQVSGKNRTTFEEMINLDIRYAKTKTVMLDLAIIFKTIPALLVQMHDNRRGRKSHLRSARPQAALSGRAYNQ
jgi:lipopolysaccharide/colanic/teichoic acid biosynthesis glycosyltransferase